MNFKECLAFGFVIFVAFAGPSRISANDDLEERVEELESKLEAVEERLERQESFADEVHQAFSNVFQTYESTGTTSGDNPPIATATTTTTTTTTTTSSTQPTTATVVHSDFVATVLDVRRERLDAGYRFTGALYSACAGLARRLHL